MQAAHCVYQRSSVVAYSIVDLNDGYYWTGSSSKIIVHENYDDTRIVNDVALFKLASSAPSTCKLQINISKYTVYLHGLVTTSGKL